MRKILTLLLLNLIAFNFVFSQTGISVNNTGNLADSSAMLDVSATGKGLLIPRMNTTERPGKPAESLLIFNTTSRCFEAYNAKTSQWVSIACLGCQMPSFFILDNTTNISATSFTVNWSVSTGATTYFLDVASDSTFTKIITGFSNLNVGNILSYNVTNLNCNGIYYFRVHADNGCGTGVYSNIKSVTTNACVQDYCTLSSQCTGNLTDSRDGTVYATVQIGNQCWMKANLSYGKYISTNVTPTNDGVTQKYCIKYDANNAANIDDPACNSGGAAGVGFGGLYTWNEIMNYTGSVSGNGPGPQGICPVGWHIPTDNEWKCMEMTLGMTKADADNYTTYPRGSTEGLAIRSTSAGAPPLWNNASGGFVAGTNTSGFTALPTGVLQLPGNLGALLCGTVTGFWTSTEDAADNSKAWVHYVHNVPWLSLLYYNSTKAGAYSLRCVKN